VTRAEAERRERLAQAESLDTSAARTAALEDVVRHADAGGQVASWKLVQACR
jgi:hypothetical protein